MAKKCKQKRENMQFISFVGVALESLEKSLKKRAIVDGFWLRGLDKRSSGKRGLKTKKERTHKYSNACQRESTLIKTGFSSFRNFDREQCFEIAIRPKSGQFFFQRKFEVEKRDYAEEFGREIPEELVNKNLKL